MSDTSTFARPRLHGGRKSSRARGAARLKVAASVAAQYDAPVVDPLLGVGVGVSAPTGEAAAGDRRSMLRPVAEREIQMRGIVSSGWDPDVNATNAAVPPHAFEKHPIFGFLMCNVCGRRKMGHPLNASRGSDLDGEKTDGDGNDVDGSSGGDGDGGGDASETMFLAVELEDSDDDDEAKKEGEGEEEADRAAQALAMADISTNDDRVGSSDAGPTTVLAAAVMCGGIGDNAEDDDPVPATQDGNDSSEAVETKDEVMERDAAENVTDVPTPSVDLPTRTDSFGVAGGDDSDASLFSVFSAAASPAGVAPAGVADADNLDIFGEPVTAAAAVDNEGTAGTGGGECDDDRSVSTRQRTWTMDKIAEEVLQTERSYVTSLRVLVALYLKPLRNPETHEGVPVIDQTLIKMIFGNVDQVLDVNELFLADLEEKMTHWSGLMDVSSHEAISECFRRYE